MRIGLIVLAAVVVVVIVLLAYMFGLFGRAPSVLLDTETHSFEIGGYYGTGTYGDELLESDKIVSNVTGINNTTVSQTVRFQGAVCPRTPGLGRVFLDGGQMTEPDAIYKIYVSDELTMTIPMELGGSSTPNVCISLPKREYIVSGGLVGSVKVEMFVYIFSFERGAGGYSLMASDQANLT